MSIRQKPFGVAAEAPSGAQRMEIRTKFLRLRSPVSLGERIEGWRVCWLGGWDKGRIFFVVMVERKCRRTPHHDHATVAESVQQRRTETRRLPMRGHE